MANNTQTFTGRVLLDDKQAKQALGQLQESLKRVRKEKREALAKGEDIVGFNKKINQLTASINALNTRQKQVNDTLNNLSSASYKELSVAEKTLQKQLRSGAVERSSEEWKSLQRQLKKVKQRWLLLTVNQKSLPASCPDYGMDSTKTGEPSHKS